MSVRANPFVVPFWTLPPVFLVIVIAVVLFPFRLLYERLTGRS
jgi:hypothetical protein